MGCAICFAIETVRSRDSASEYPGEVCAACDSRAVAPSGAPPNHDSESDDGDNPVYVDGVKCWRRYRFGGYVTMRDDTPCSSISQFYGITAFPEWSRGLLDAAAQALRDTGEPVPSGVGAPLAAGRYMGASFEYDAERWVVCRTPLVSSNAQLLDATVALKASRDADRALAILDPPEGSAKPHSAPPEYVARYRRAVWHGLGVAFATADELAAGWHVDPVRPRTLAAWLDDLARSVRSGLVDMGVNPESLSTSREAEAIVRPLCDRLLASFGFSGASSVSYQSYWRRPAADGVWVREGAAVPERIHLEVKLTEDDQAPFCQVFEGLGVADAVFQVRLVRRAVRERLNALNASHPWLPAVKKQVEERLPVRFIEVA